MTEREMQIYHWCMWDYIVHRMVCGHEKVISMKVKFVRITETTDSTKSYCYMCDYYKVCSHCLMTTKGGGKCTDCGSDYWLVVDYNDVKRTIKIRDIFGDASGQRNTLYNFVVMDTLRRGILNGTLSNALDYIQKENELTNFFWGAYDYLLLETPEATDRFVQAYTTAGDMIETDPQKAAETIKTAYAKVTLL